MCVCLGQAIRERLLVGSPAHGDPSSPAAAAYRLSCALDSGGGRRGDVDPSEMSEFERCVASLVQAQELLGCKGEDEEVWRLAEREIAKTLLLQAERMEEAPQEPPPPPIHLRVDGTIPQLSPMAPPRNQFSFSYACFPPHPTSLRW